MRTRDMNRIKLARIRRCMHCEKWRNATANVWLWPRCIAGTPAPDGEPTLALDDGFMEGPETNCPLGRWAGLLPVDIEGEEEKGRLKDYTTMRDWPLGKRLSVRLLKAAILKVGLPTVRVWVLDAVGAQEYPLWLPVEITKELGAQGVVPATAYQAVLKDGAARVLAAAWGGNGPAYYALRDCVESGACTRAEAEAVAAELGIAEPSA